MEERYDDLIPGSDPPIKAKLFHRSQGNNYMIPISRGGVCRVIVIM